MNAIRAVLLLISLVAIAYGEPQRARPPEFTEEDRAAFFDDAFATLVGARPEPSAPATVQQGPSQPAPAAASAWTDLIDADTLETEIKRQANRLRDAVRSATAFKAGGFRDAVDALSMLATCFAITERHDDQPRWRDAADGWRTRLAAAVEGADAATDAGHKAATDASQALADLVHGGRPETPDPTALDDWAALATRSALMRRMEAAEAERLRGWVADQRTFRRNAQDARHEAQVLAALAEAIVQPGADDEGDDDYEAFARTLRDAARAVAEASDAEDLDAATRAMTEVSRSCVDCHADYRG